MNRLKYSGHFKTYFRLPLYMIVIFAIQGALIFYRGHYKTGLIFLGCLIIYTIAIFLVYSLNQKSLDDNIINFATNYSTVQSRILEEMDIPYALMTQDGKMMWANTKFTDLTGKGKTYQKSITTIFPEITREMLETQEDEDVLDVPVDFQEGNYRVNIKRVSVQAREHGEATGFAEDVLLAVTVYDETALLETQKALDDEQLVVGLVYIDNYEENIDSVEAVKKSMLRAFIERKINKYFQGVDAIVRRIERDKFIVIFEKKSLAKLEEDKFSILEDIKTTKVGNENEITLSIGIGLNGISYNTNADYARTAIEVALGRGGSQAVIKNGSEMTYYGSRGKEIEKNTRVKARVKAQALRELMNTHDNVIIMGHQISDVDCLGAAIGIYCGAREVGKKAQIVINNVTTSVRPLVDLFSVDAGYEKDMFIDSTSALAMCGPRTLVVVVDTNRPSYTECPQLLNKCDDVVVFDHHRQGKELIENPLLSYIEPYASSAAEMVAECLQYFAEKVHIRSAEADAIYAGILIDTNNFMTKTGVRTFEAAAYLKRNGAEVVRVRKLLREDMEAYKARAEIVRNATVYKEAFAISQCDTKGLESPTIVSAQASNELLNIVGIKASFVLTEFNKKIYISSRSIDEIDVQKIMEELGGGGHMSVAGAQIENSSIEEVKNQITAVLDRLIEEGEIKL